MLKIGVDNMSSSWLKAALNYKLFSSLFQSDLNLGSTCISVFSRFYRIFWPICNRVIAQFYNWYHQSKSTEEEESSFFFCPTNSPKRWKLRIWAAANPHMTIFSAFFFFEWVWKLWYYYDMCLTFRNCSCLCLCPGVYSSSGQKQTSHSI